MILPKVASLFSLVLAPCLVLGDTLTYKGADSKYQTLVYFPIRACATTAS